MKLFLILILSFSFLIGQSQNYQKAKLSQSTKVLTTLAIWSISNGIGDALNDSGHKTAGHALNAFSAAALLSGTIWSQPVKRDWLTYLISSAGVRFVTFDYAYNLTRGLPIEYSGTTSPDDRIKNKVPAGFKTFTKATVLCFTLGFTINTLNPKYQIIRK
jgi:hypothetical protein